MELRYWAAAVIAWFVLISMAAYKTDLPTWACSAIGFAGFLAVVAYGNLQ